MFGYIVPFVPELRVREAQTYCAHYCGLCRTLRERYGKISILNYDAAFLSLLLASLTAAAPLGGKSRCVLHPVSGRPVLRSEPQRYASDINVLMAYAKAQDDRKDEGGLKALLELSGLQHAFGKARAYASSACSGMQECRKRMDDIEEEGTADIDAAADPYGVLLGNIFADGYVLQSHILYELGYQLGRWVYLIDALDDMEEDEKKGRFNVFVNRAEERGQDIPQIREEARFTLFYTLSQAVQALGRLDLKRNRQLLENILYLGLRRQTENVLAGKGRLGPRSADVGISLFDWSAS